VLYFRGASFGPRRPSLRGRGDRSGPPARCRTIPIAPLADGSDAHLVFELRPGAYNDETLIDFLNDVHELEQQRAVLLIWDGPPSHRSRRMTDWIISQRQWLSVEPLPGYAPDLNPIENVWGSLKSKELANLCSDTIGEVAEVAEVGLDRIGSDAPLCFAFLRHSGLHL
jgi:putative transposase